MTTYPSSPRRLQRLFYIDELVIQHGDVRAGPRGDQVYEELQHAPRAAGRQVEPAAHAPPSLGLQQVRTTTEQIYVELKSPSFPDFLLEREL